MMHKMEGKEQFLLWSRAKKYSLRSSKKDCGQQGSSSWPQYCTLNSTKADTNSMDYCYEGIRGEFLMSFHTHTLQQSSLHPYILCKAPFLCLFYSALVFPTFSRINEMTLSLIRPRNVTLHCRSIQY